MIDPSDIYRRLPPGLRSGAASLRGLSLRRWRYGRDTPQIAQAAREREHWSANQWRRWREERLAYVLHRAATRVPYYRRYWEARRRRGDRASWEALENWPILEKETVRREPLAFVADDCDVRRMFHLRTGGTTGTPLDIWRSRHTLRTLYGIGTARTRGWNGVTLRDRRAMLGGQLVVPSQRQRPPFWVWNLALRQLYMSTYHLRADFIQHYLDALARYRVVYLTGYASSIHALAHEALQAGRTELAMRVALTSSEPLAGYQRTAIAQAFHCPVRETYGMGETVAAATECEAGRLHLWPEAGWIEVRDNDQPAPQGAAGEFVCTGLLNADMPLIRYRLGDRGRLAPSGTACPCGRTLPIIAGLEGRTTDLLLTPDGRHVFWLNSVLYGVPIRECQFVQDSLSVVRVRYAPARGFSEASKRVIEARLVERMGAVRVAFEEVERVPRTANGKVRGVICNVPEADRAAAVQGTSRPPKPVPRSARPDRA